MSAPAPTSTASGPDVDDLRTEIAAVARAQRTSDERLAAALDAVRRMDGLVSGLRDPGRVDDAKEEWPAVDGAVGSVEAIRLRDGFVRLAREIDGARATLVAVLDDLPTEWERRYLQAEDAVLVALRSYAETTDRLAQTLAQEWPVYAELRARTATFVEQRWFYRTSQEAADAYELAVGPVLGDLAAAQRAIAAAREERDDAAAAVNGATEAADDVWEARDAASPASP